jgi:hypothetical protein
MGKTILPDWAKDRLLNQKVVSVEESYPHARILGFANGAALCLTALPMEGGILDASILEGSADP